MAKIRILDATLANMIAAGEVVERPSSVVKELVENALDANATKIDITIKNAGRTYICVQDDGSGMEEEDAILAFRRHATSKIFSPQSLFRIETLGFRGEAIPSISAVAKVTIETSTGDKVGTKIISHPEQPLEISHFSARKGTIITVEELFYQTPARLKHLKSDYTEVANIQEVVTKLAFGHPNVAFSLRIDEKDTFLTSGNNNLLEIIAAFYGVSSAKQMEYIEFEDNDFTIKGYISRIGLTRSNRYGLTTLLNGRVVRMNLVNNAIIDSYKTFIPVDRYPMAVLLIETDPSLVDVNVHPSKHEVRLSKEDSLVDLIKTHIKEKLSGYVMNVEVDSRYVQGSRSIQTKLDLEIPLEDSFPVESSSYTSEEPIGYQTVQEEEPLNFMEPEKEVPESIKEEKRSSSDQGSFLLQLSIVGQIHGTYIVASSNEGFYLIDQHAAMERVNYEYYMKAMDKEKYTTPLLIPIIIELSLTEIELLKDRLSALEEIGIRMELFGATSVRVVEIPTWMRNVDMKMYVEDMIQFVLKRNVARVSLKQEAIMTLSCKASLKANKALTMEDMQMIIKRLAQCENPHSCPHGRPTMIFYSTYAIEKAFRRVG